jgi:sulfatase modifying factor 1
MNVAAAASNSAGMVSPGAAPAKDMAWVPGGDFAMGSIDFYPEERPVHRVAAKYCS